MKGRESGSEVLKEGGGDVVGEGKEKGEMKGGKGEKRGCEKGRATTEEKGWVCRGKRRRNEARVNKGEKKGEERKKRRGSEGEGEKKRGEKKRL